MRKMYLSAPLPFVGQKRMLAKEFMKVLEQYPDGTLFVDLFGGSGLLSHITKSLKPHSTVIYNDFDNYRFRMKHIPQTNQLLADIREMVGNSVSAASSRKRIAPDMWISLPSPPLSCFP